MFIHGLFPCIYVFFLVVFLLLKPCFFIQTLRFHPIGSFQSCYRQRCGTPRQSNLVTLGWTDTGYPQQWWQRVHTWRIIPVTRIYVPFRPVGRGTTLLRGLTNLGYSTLTNWDDPPSRGDALINSRNFSTLQPFIAGYNSPTTILYMIYYKKGPYKVQIGL